MQGLLLYPFLKNKKGGWSFPTLNTQSHTEHSSQPARNKNSASLGHTNESCIEDNHYWFINTSHKHTAQSQDMQQLVIL